MDAIMYKVRLFRVFRKRLPLRRTLETASGIVKSPVKDVVIPKNVLLQNYMLDRLARWDEKVAVECIETNRGYTYLDLRRKSSALAHFLKNKLKVEEKSTVAVLLPNLPEYPIIILGAVHAGLCVSTINPNYTPDEIKKQLVNSKSKVLFTLAEIGQDIINIARNLGIPIIGVKFKESDSLSRGTINFFEIINSQSNVSHDVRTETVTSDDVVFLPFSSGTTGVSKGVELTHDNMVSNLEQAAAKEFSSRIADEDEVVVAFLPFFHIYGLSVVMLHKLHQGAKLVTIPKFSTNSFVRTLREHRPTFIPCVPPVVLLMMSSPQIKPSEDLASVTEVMTGAAPLGSSDIARFRELTNGKVEIVQAYGMTESSPLVTKGSRHLKGGITIGGSGFLVPNTEVKFVDPDTQNVLGPGEIGELFVRGPQVMKGYFNNPEATRETISEDGWLKTGDIGYSAEDGHIYITDRIKDLIKVKGFQVAPAELEAVIRTHPLVEDVAVIGVPHPMSGEAPRAFVVPRKNAQLKPEDIKEFMATKVAKFKQLDGGIVFLDLIPRNPSGKILRRELRKLE